MVTLMKIQHRLGSVCCGDNQTDYPEVLTATLPFVVTHHTDIVVSGLTRTWTNAGPVSPNPRRPVQRRFHCEPAPKSQPRGRSRDVFGSARPWEIHAHKEWHLEGRASISLMQISESHCGWYREQVWTQNGQQTQRRAEWHGRHQARVLFPRQLITALNNGCTVKPGSHCSCSLFSPATYRRYHFPGKVTWNIPRSPEPNLPCFLTQKQTKEGLR